MTMMDGEPPRDSGPAKLFAALGFFYALAAVTLLLLFKDFFRDDPNRDAVLLWQLVPIVSSFGTWMAVYSGFPPLRAWVWLGIVLTLLFCWIAVFSFGLLFLPVVLFFSSRRSETGFLVLSGYCATVAIASIMALAFRDRFSFWAGLSVNALGVLAAAVLLAYLVVGGDSDWWTLLFLAVPAALNLLAVLLVRRSRGPSDDTFAMRR